jgi:hypothetical protein
MLKYFTEDRFHNAPHCSLFNIHFSLTEALAEMVEPSLQLTLTRTDWQFANSKVQGDVQLK